MPAARAKPRGVVARGPVRTARWVRVKVDMDRLRSQLAPRSRCRVDEAELRKWLRRSGFRPQGDWWIVRESALGQLAPSEVAAAEPMGGAAAIAGKPVAGHFAPLRSRRM